VLNDAATRGKGGRTMSNEEIEAKLDSLAESLRHVQVIVQANSLLLGAIVDNLADRAFNRHDCLAILFDGACTRAERTSVDEQSQQTNDLAREELSKFFASVAASQDRSQTPGLHPSARASHMPHRF
jgi:hypothetical protein